MLLNFNNNGAIVLTSQNPEAFISFIQEPGDSSIYLTPLNGLSNGQLKESIFFVNGIDACTLCFYDNRSTLILGTDGSPGIAAFHVYTRETEDFNYCLRFDSSGSFEGIRGWTSNFPALILNPTDQREIWRT